MCGVFLNVCYLVVEKHIQENVYGKSLLKIVLTSFNVILSIIIPFRCPQFYVQPHSTKLALKHLFDV